MKFVPTQSLITAALLAMAATPGRCESLEAAPISPDVLFEAFNEANVMACLHGDSAAVPPELLCTDQYIHSRKPVSVSDHEAETGKTGLPGKNFVRWGARVVFNPPANQQGISSAQVSFRINRVGDQVSGNSVEARIRVGDDIYVAGLDSSGAVLNGTVDICRIKPQTPEVCIYDKKATVIAALPGWLQASLTAVARTADAVRKDNLGLPKQFAGIAP